MPARPIVNMKFDSGRRIIVTGDIHAHLSLFERLLEKVGFSGDDFLIVLGDAIESGEASLGTLRRVMELERAGRALMLAGNWEHFMVEMLASESAPTLLLLRERTLSNRAASGSSMLSDMCSEMGAELTPDTDMAALMPRVRAAFRREIEYMRALPLMLETEDWSFVHGGIPSPPSEDDYAYLKNDAFAEQGARFERWLITGHWPVANYDRDIPRHSPHFFPDQRIAAIDGGCGKLQAAQLNALMLRAGSPEDFEWDYVDDFPKVRALEAQQPSENPLHTVWNTRFIDLIEMGGEFSRVLHWDTGRELVVPTARLWQQAGEYMLGDYTDYALSVEKGDVLGVVMETSRGLYCKNGSVCGWYYGGYAPEH